MLRRSLAVAAAALLVAGAAFAANGDRQQIHRTAADDAAAKATLLRLSDLGAGWRGGLKKPDLSPGPTCANFKPKQSDLVLTGAAESDFTVPNDVRSVSSQVQILKTAHMVALDWQRTVLAPGLVPCLRTFLAKGLPQGTTIVSVAKLPFAQVAQYAAGYRITSDVTANGQTVRIIVDELLFGAQRTEISMTVLDLASRGDAALSSETGWARTLVARIHA